MEVGAAKVGLEQIIDRMCANSDTYRTSVGKEKLMHIMKLYFKASNNVIRKGEAYRYPNRWGTVRLVCRKIIPKEKRPIGAILLRKKLGKLIGFFYYFKLDKSHIVDNMDYTFRADKDTEKFFRRKLYNTDMHYSFKREDSCV